jgi:hypothetical protein
MGRSDHQFHAVGVLHDASASKPKPRRFAEKLPEMLGANGLEVRAEGGMVVFTIGRTTAKLPYPVARNLAQWLRVRGKEAKHNAGETRHWSRLIAAVGQAGSV